MSEAEPLPFDGIKASVLFFLKLDFALLAGTAALASLLRADPDTVLFWAGHLRGALGHLMWLIGGGLLIEAVLTLITLYRPKAAAFAHRRTTVTLVAVAYIAYIVGHVGLLSYLAGAVMGALEALPGMPR